MNFDDTNFSPYGDTQSVYTTLQQVQGAGGKTHRLGVWLGQISYNSGDFVYYHDGTSAGLYCSLVADNQGVVPTNQTNWRLLISCSGAGGSTGGGTGGITGIAINGSGNYTNIAFGTGFTVTGNAITLTPSGTGSVGDMLKSQYDSDNDGKVNSAHAADQVPWSGIIGRPVFATVAITGSYNDLLDKPVIPAAQVNADWNATTGLAQILNKPTVFPPADHTHSIYITDAPTDGKQYVRFNGTWAESTTTSTSGIVISTTDTPGTVPYSEIIFDPNFVVNGNIISLYNNGNIICGIDPNIRTFTENRVVTGSGMVVTAHSMNDAMIQTLRPDLIYSDIFEVISARPLAGAESTTNFIAGLFDARTSDVLNRERVYGIVSDVSAEAGWNPASGIVKGAEINIHNKSGVDSAGVHGLDVIYADTAGSQAGWALGVGVAPGNTSGGFRYGLSLDGVKGANSTLIHAPGTNCSAATGIDFSAIDFSTKTLLKGNCITISQDGVFDTPCTGKAVFQQGVDVVGDLNVSKIIFPDATEMTTAAITGALYWIAPYTGFDQPGIGSNTLDIGQSRVWHSPTGSFIINRKDDSHYYAVEMNLVL